MLFQGQEYGASTPFTYFADHHGELGKAVAEGRADFLAQFPPLKTAEMRAAMPDPADGALFARCKLDNDERMESSACARLHRDLLRLRHEDVVLSALGTADVIVESAAPTASLLLLRYGISEAHRLLVVNLADEYSCPMNDALFAPVPGTQWQQLWSSEQLQYGGGGAQQIPDVNPWEFPAHSAILFAASA